MSVFHCRCRHSIYGTNCRDRTMEALIRVHIALMAWAITFQSVEGAASSKRAADGREWTMANLNVHARASYCYEDSELNCRRYGRPYTWESAKRACRSLGRGWRLPTDDEWRELAKRQGGVAEDSRDQERAAFAALLSGGRSGFDGLLGGGRVEGKYSRLGAHGFYWTSSRSGPEGAWFYNFGKGSHALYRQSGGDLRMAFSVRCVRQ